jgi:hypothetical protein
MKQESTNTKKLGSTVFGPRLDVNLLFATSLFLGFVGMGCCSSFDAKMAKEDIAARGWLHRWQDPADWQNIAARGVAEFFPKDTTPSIHKRDCRYATEKGTTPRRAAAV